MIRRVSNLLSLAHGVFLERDDVHEDVAWLGHRDVVFFEAVGRLHWYDGECILVSVEDHALHVHFRLGDWFRDSATRFHEFVLGVVPANPCT